MIKVFNFKVDIEVNPVPRIRVGSKLYPATELPLIDLDIDKVTSCEITVNSAIQNQPNGLQWLNDDSVDFNIKFQQNAITT